MNLLEGPFVDRAFAPPVPDRSDRGGAPPATRFAIGDFVVDGLRRQLTRADDGTVVPISARHFDALLFFVQHGGTLLDKEMLLAALWPGLVVEDNSLSQTVSALRRLLGDDAQAPRYLQTVPRRGFRFIAPVVPLDEASPAWRPEPAAPAVGAEAEVAVDAAAEARAGHAGAASSADAAGVPTAGPAAPTPMRRRLIGTLVAATAVAAGGGLAWRARPPRDAAAVPQTLAVLPFRPIAAAAGDELLEIGMADSLVTRLSNVPGVVVRSVGSVRRFAGSDQDPLQAARALDVQWIVDGSIQRAGDRIRLTARLLDAAVGQAAWSGTFDERFTSVFDVQDTISTRVAAVLAPALSPAWQAQRARAGGTRRVDAYQLYLAARQRAQSVRAGDLADSIALYDRAIAADPSYALAFAGRSESRRRTVFGADGEPDVVLRTAGRDAERAIDLDPALAEGHAVLGWKRLCLDWDWTGSESVFRRAIDLNASEANAHFGYGTLLGTMGRRPAALEHLRTARTLDPLSPMPLTVEAAALYASGERDEARRRLQRVHELDPQFWLAHLTEGGWLASEGDAAASIAAYRRADRLADGGSQPAAALGHALATNGQTREAREVADRLLAAARERYVPPTSYGLVLAGLGERAGALDALEKAVAVHDVRLVTLRTDDRWSRAVGDAPRYQAVMRRLGFTA